MATQSLVFGSVSNVAGALQSELSLALIPHVVAKKLLSVPEAEYVYVSNGNDGVRHVWTIVDSPPEAVYDAIYDQEKELIQAFKTTEFDFHVIAREGRPLRSVITLSCQGWRQAD
jgi:hypothetical protein